MTYYEVLGISYTADKEEIDRAYRAAIRNAHPDIGGSPEKAARVNEAYSVLSDFVSRQNYDRSIGAHTAFLGGNKVTPPAPDTKLPRESYRVAPPREFTEVDAPAPDPFERSAPPKVGSARNNSLRSYLGWARVGLAVLAVASVVFATVTSQSLEVGLVAFVATAGVMALTLFFISPLRHPWWFYGVLVIAFAIPMDELQQENLLPVLFEGVGAPALLMTMAAFVFALVYRFVLHAHQQAKALT